MRYLKIIVFMFMLMALGIPPGVKAQETVTEHTGEVEILDRLHEEAKKAYYVADYPTALEKWQAGLNRARTLNNKRYISGFLGKIGEV